MNCDSYNMLYKRFLKRGPGQMLDLAGFKKGDSFLDLCCGTGRASIEARSRGASKIIGVDETGKKLSCEVDLWGVFNVTGSIKFYECTVSQFFEDIKDSPDMKFDCIFCQQAINYWLREDNHGRKPCAELISKALTPTGKFIFNTFNKKPSEEIVVKEYKIDNVHYAEVSQLVDGFVYHGQFCDGFEPDHQEFRWISPEEFMSLLKPYFKNISVHEDGPTDIYVCHN